MDLGGDIKGQINNLVLLFFVWWYGQGFLSLIKYLKALFLYLTDLFSVRLIFQTLFLPWKRDQLSAKGLPLNERFNIWMLNLASRLIGFLIKLIFFLVYLIFLTVWAFLSLILIIFWIIWPFAAIGSIIVGILSLLG